MEYPMTVNFETNNMAVRDLVRDGQVSRRLYTDPALFELEMGKIFGSAWIFVGHESQVKEAGDFFTASIGRARVIVARHADGKIYAFHNRCSHRGAEVCQEKHGNRSSFECPYHAWTFSTNGDLLSVPLARAYGENFRSRMPELGLEHVPRVDNYRGFIFANLRSEGVDLSTFLGSDVRAAFDNFVDRAPDGEIAAAGGKAVQCYRGNWKLHIENSIDFLHPSILHRNAIDAAEHSRSHFEPDHPVPLEVDLVRANGLTLGEWDRVGVVALDRGHCWSGGFIQDTVDTEHENISGASPKKKAESPAQQRYQAALVLRHGKERANEILGFKRHNTLVYPNLFINSGVQRIRVLNPTAVNRTEQHSYVFRLKGAPEEIFRIAVCVVTQSNTPSSIVTTDDHEALERVQEALSGGDREWIEVSRGLGRERPHGDGLTAEGTNELLIRNQHKAWLGYMTGTL
jgi:phenylpropionate dioxygenase-like ring-hydroxylating dioxygenase large terminal subunit